MSEIGPGLPVIEMAPPSAQDVVMVPIAGPPGPTGPEGPPGTPGDSGAGTKWFAGTGPPPAVVVGASAGDMYVDGSTGDLYRLNTEE